MKDFTKVINAFHQEYIKAVTEHRYGAELPLNLGKHMIVSYRSKRNYPRFKGPSDTLPTIHTNLATDGLKCKLVYSNHDSRYRFKDKYIWEFAPEVPFKKEVSKAFVANHNMYIFNPNKADIFYRGLDFKLRSNAEAKIEKFLLTYDEFELN